MTELELNKEKEKLKSTISIVREILEQEKNELDELYGIKSLDIEELWRRVESKKII